MPYLAKVGKVSALLVVGLALAFYPVFVVVFTDKHSVHDYATGLLFVGSAFAFLAGLTGLLARSWRVPFMLTPPGILVITAYSHREPHQVPYHLAVVGTLLLGTVVGAVAGARLRSPGG